MQPDPASSRAVRSGSPLRIVACITVAALAASACGVGPKRKKSEQAAKVTAAEILIDPKFDLNFAPTLNQALFIQFTMRNVRSSEEKFVFKAQNAKGEDITEAPNVFGTPIRKFSQEGSLYTIVVSVPFILGDKTIGGFKAAVSLPGYTDGEGKEIVKETQFALRLGAYPQDHFSQESSVADFAVLNEFLLPPERADLDLASYAEAVLNVAALSSAQETDRARLSNRMAITSEGGQKVISLKGNVAFSYSTPGKAIIRTNGFRTAFLGGDWSGVTVEVGVNANTRRAGNAASPEIAIYALKPPKLVNQTMTDDPEGAYPASRGPRGVAADLNRCNVLVGKLTQNIEGFPGDRATCNDNFQSLKGQDQALTLTFRRFQTDIPVMPDDGLRLDGIVALTKADGTSIFTDLNARSCVFDDSNPRLDTCVFANYTKALTPRKGLNEGEELASNIEANHASKILPYSNEEGTGGYAGEGSVVATRATRTNPNEKLAGSIVARPKMDALDGKVFGWEGHWKPGGAAYNAIANRCFETLRSAASSQDVRIPGATPDKTTLVAPEADSDKGRKVTFATRFPGLTLLDSVSFSTKVGDVREDARGGALEVTPGETGEFIGLEAKKVFRFKESYRNRLRPLAAKLTVLGEPGLDGYDAPATRAVFPAAVDEAGFLAAYDTLAGPAGLPGLPLGFPRATERTFTPGAWRVELKDGAATTAIADMDKHLAETYGVTVQRDAQGLLTGFTYFPIKANLPRGNELSYEFVASEMQAQASAPFDVVSRVSGTLTLDAVPNLELQPSVTNPGAGAVSGVGGVNVGVENSTATPLSGFFGFGQGSLPFLFKNCGLCSGYQARHEGESSAGGSDGGGSSGGGGRSGGGSTAGGDNGDSKTSPSSDGKDRSYIERAYAAVKEFFNNPSSPHNNKSTARADEDKARGERAKAVIPLSQRYVAETALWECKKSGLFESTVLKNVYNTDVVNMKDYPWQAKATKHFWISDASFPACGSVDGNFINPKKCKRAERTAGPDSVINEMGRDWHKWPGSYEEYLSEVRNACLRSEDVAKAAAATNKEVANKTFLEQKCPIDDGCAQAQAANSRISKLLEDANGAAGTLIESDAYSPAVIAELKTNLGAMMNNKNAVIRVLKESTSNGVPPSVPWYGEPKPSWTIEEAIAKATVKIAEVEAAARPGIVGSTLPQCSYDISGGRFRAYGRAAITSPLSAYGGLAKQTNQKTSLVQDYAYPKFGAPSVTDAIQAPDRSPLMAGEHLVLKDPDTAKPGIANALTRGIAVDCADIANQARREKIPLPRKMFTSDICRAEKLAKR
jgi:hypothetical protein